MFKHWKMLVLTLLLLNLSASCVESAIHALWMSRANGRLLSSHSLHQSSVRGLTDCVQLCLRRFEECSSIAYDEDSQTCDLFASVAGKLVALMFPANVLLYTIPYRDCTDVKQRMSVESGVYQIKPCSSWDAFLAYCDMITDGKAWTVFQRRQDGSVDFNQNWQNYASGFGDLNGEFWLGNKKIHKITSSAKYEFRIDMVTNDNDTYHVTYDSIEIGSEAENFRLNLGEYVGVKSNAAEGLHHSNESLHYHNGMSFSTFDRDNDNLRSYSCSILSGSAWWFNKCSRTNLNGKYKLVNVWDGGRSSYILQFSELKVRRVI